MILELNERPGLAVQLDNRWGLADRLDRKGNEKMIKQAKWFILSAVLMSLAAAAPAADNPQATMKGLETNVKKFSAINGRFDALLEHMDGRMENMPEGNGAKDAWLNIIAALSTAASICEYEYDQLTLYWEMGKEHRRPYSGIRSASLDHSTRQIHLMQRQIDISRTLLPAKRHHSDLVVRIDTLMSEATELLERCRVQADPMK